MADYFPAPGRNHLFVPGPTNIPDKVIQAMTRNNEDHRSPAFPVLSKTCLEDVKQLFGTKKGHAFIFPSTGEQAF
jgi:alanine-glyoxylate transaminase/serine-glyoxylate transaminase/serine-pyruvate transaminase